MVRQPLTNAPMDRGSQPIFLSFSKNNKQLLTVHFVSDVALGTCYKSELDMVPAPQGTYSLAGEGKLISQQMFAITYYY